MEVRELRIGNYLQLKGENFRVSEIQNNLQCVELKRKNLENPRLNDYEECDLDCNDLLPITVSEEWFLNLGFKRITTNEYWFVIPLKDRSLNVSTVGNVEIKSWDMLIISLGCVCEYVHQLQNLYFALTGNELNIKQ